MSEASEPQAYVGEWRLEVEGGSCGPALSIGYIINQDAADHASDELINVVSEWWFASRPETRAPLTGSISWWRDEFDLRFHSMTSIAQGSFTGRGASPTRLEGTFLDPRGDFWGRHRA